MHPACRTTVDFTHFPQLLVASEFQNCNFTYRPVCIAHIFRLKTLHLPGVPTHPPLETIPNHSRADGSTPGYNRRAALFTIGFQPLAEPATKDPSWRSNHWRSVFAVGLCKSPACRN